MGELKQKNTKDFYSVEEYLSILAASEIRVEYLNGQIRYMAGGTINHSLISANMIGLLGEKLKGKPCRVFSPDLQVHIAKKNSYVLPDATVICGKPEISEQDKNSVTNPTVIVEVLSESTKRYDYSEKGYLYRSIPSLKEYVIVHQSEKKIEIYSKREGKDIWQIKTYFEEDEFIKLESLNLQIMIDDLYDGVGFE